MGSWFPIAEQQIENEAFKALTPTEKLYFWQVLSEFNLSGGQYYKSDIWFAATLKLSVEKIRKARAKLSKMELIEMVPGTMDKRGRKIATTYKGIRWAVVADGDRFMQMNRPTFERLIDYIRLGRFTHEDVVCFVYAKYLVWIRGGQYAEVTKSEFIAFTGIPRAVKCMDNLLSNFKFSNGETLLEFTEGYRTVRIEDVRSVAFNQDQLIERNQEIEQRIQTIKEQDSLKERAKARQAGKIFAEDLLPIFKELYAKHHDGKQPQIGDNQYDRKLSKLGEPAKVAKAIERYFSTELPSGLVNHSIHSFIKYADRYL